MGNSHDPCIYGDVPRIGSELFFISANCYVGCYILAPGVSFDLLQRLYKLEHHTVMCCSAYIRYMHCGPDIWTAGLSFMITPGPRAINQLKHPIVRDLAVYTHSALGRYAPSGLVLVSNT